MTTIKGGALTLHGGLESRQEAAWLRSALVEHLVSRVEIAQMLGVSPQRVHQLLQTGDFPEPVADLAIGKVWRREDIEAWAERTGRTSRPAEGE